MKEIDKVIAIIMKNLRTKACQERKAKNLTQKELAKKAGLSENIIGYLEAGGAPHLTTLIKLSYALNVQISELLGEK